MSEEPKAEAEAPAAEPDAPKKIIPIKNEALKRDAWRDNPKFIAKTWRPGTSGNPGGRKKRAPSVYDAVEKLLAKVPEGQQKEVRELIADVLVAKALRGDMKALREIIGRSDPIAIRLAGAEGGPIEFASKLVVGIDADAMARGVDPEDGSLSLPPAESSGEDEEKDEEPLGGDAPDMA